MTRDVIIFISSRDKTALSVWLMAGETTRDLETLAANLEDEKPIKRTRARNYDIEILLLATIRPSRRNGQEPVQSFRVGGWRANRQAHKYTRTQRNGKGNRDKNLPLSRKKPEPVLGFPRRCLVSKTIRVRPFLIRVPNPNFCLSPPRVRSEAADDSSRGWYDFIIGLRGARPVPTTPRETGTNGTQEIAPIWLWPLVPTSVSGVFTYTSCSNDTL